MSVSVLFSISESSKLVFSQGKLKKKEIYIYKVKHVSKMYPFKKYFHYKKNTKVSN